MVSAHRSLILILDMSFLHLNQVNICSVDVFPSDRFKHSYNKILVIVEVEFC